MNPTPELTKMHLIIQSYQEENFARLQELKFALKTNLDNPFIYKVWDLDETDFGTWSADIVQYKKYERVPLVGKRMTFKRAFEHAISTFANGDIFIIANNDMVIDQSFMYQYIHNFFNVSEDLCMFLTRHELTTDEGVQFMSNFEIGNSQDVYIFRMSDRIRSLNLDDLDFSVGNCPRCDNRFAYKIMMQGMIPINLAIDFKTFHIDNCRKNGQLDKMVFNSKTDFRCEDTEEYLYVPVIRYNKFLSFKSYKQGFILQLYSQMATVIGSILETSKGIQDILRK